jgi:thioesterase domain-containing protein
MLAPIQTSGDKPPLFFVHGLHGVMPLGRILAEGLGPDQPLYAVHANGIDGRKPVLDDLRKMVAAYVEDIEAARPAGPLVVGGMCDGTLAAIELARELQNRGRQIGPVILADPLPVPRQVGGGNVVDSRKPEVARQLRQGVYATLLAYASRPYNEMPFDASDPEQVHRAASAGLGTLVALAGFFPTPFPGPVQMIASVQRSASLFHPQMPWHKLLTGPRMVLVLPWHHMQLFRDGRETVARALKFLLEEASAFEIIAECRTDADTPIIKQVAHAVNSPAVERAQ